MGVGLTHTEKFFIKKFRVARETGDLEAEIGEDFKKPDIERVVESYFNLPNQYSSSIILTNSDFIPTNRTCAKAIAADMSFGTALAADFKKEYRNIELLWKQRPGLGGVAALPPAASRIPGKYLYFLVTRATERQQIHTEDLVLSLEREVREHFSLPNEYSSSLTMSDSDFILTKRTCAIAITADVSFKTA